MAKSRRNRKPGVLIAPGTPKRFTRIDQASVLPKQFFNSKVARKKMPCKVIGYVQGEPVSTKVVKSK
jgi:hypothetical protein